MCITANQQIIAATVELSFSITYLRCLKTVLLLATYFNYGTAQLRITSFLHAWFPVVFHV